MATISYDSQSFKSFQEQGEYSLESEEVRKQLDDFWLK